MANANEEAESLRQRSSGKIHMPIYAAGEKRRGRYGEGTEGQPLSWHGIPVTAMVGQQGLTNPRGIGRYDRYLSLAGLVPIDSTEWVTETHGAGST